MTFGTPIALLLILFIPLILEIRPGVPYWQTLLRRLRHEPPAALLFCSQVDLGKLPVPFRVKARPYFINLSRSLSCLLLITALARPQYEFSISEQESSGRDIMLVLDVSGSMEAVDFSVAGEHVTRLTALKTVVKEFVDERRGDRMGLVVFGTDVFTQCPLTLDSSIIKSLVDELQVGMAGDATAIGDAIAVGLKRLKDIPAESRVMVLVTDGMQTAGKMNPLDAAQAAQELGIKIYSIGIGGKAPAPFIKKNLLGLNSVQYYDVPIDEEALQNIAEKSGGVYFNAGNTDQLQKIYEQINQIEKRSERFYDYIEYQEMFAPFLLAGIALFLLAELCAELFFRSVP